MKHCLERFCTALGQKVNNSKSQVFFSKNTNANLADDNLADDISNDLGIPRTSELGRYLGMPTINGRVNKQTFQGVSDLLISV